MALGRADPQAPSHTRPADGGLTGTPTLASQHHLSFRDPSLSTWVTSRSQLYLPASLHSWGNEVQGEKEIWRRAQGKSVSWAS